MLAGLRLPSGISLPSPRLYLPFASLTPSHSPTQPARRNVKWIEGLRGLAAVFVVTSHLSLVLDLEVLRPQNEPYIPPRIIQWPFVRVILAGRPSVAVFFVVTGFVSALRPLQLVYRGETDAALSGLSRSAVKRFGHLFIPSTIATSINWFLNEIGAFELARQGESDWIRNGLVPRSSTPLQSIWLLSKTVSGTWANRGNALDSFQWFMLPLLKASMFVYVTLLATLRLRPQLRLCILIGLIIQSYLANDFVIGTNYSMGMVLAELYARGGVDTASPSVRRRLLASVLLIAGLYASSYPEILPELTPWSTYMRDFALATTPSKTDLTRFWPALGGILICAGIFYSPFTQEVLSHPLLLKLGQLSLPIYLIHHAVLRTFFCWLLFGVFSEGVPRYVNTGKPIPGRKIPYPTKTYQAIAYISTVVLVIYLAHLWDRFIQPWCVRGSEAMEKFVFAKGDGFSTVEVASRGRRVAHRRSSDASGEQSFEDDKDERLV